MDVQAQALRSRAAGARVEEKRRRGWVEWRDLCLLAGEPGAGGIKEGARRSGPSDPRQRCPASPGGSILAALFFSWRAVGELSLPVDLFPVSLAGFLLRTVRLAR